MTLRNKSMPSLLGGSSLLLLFSVMPNSGFAQVNLPPVTVDAPTQQARPVLRPQRTTRSARAVNRPRSPAPVQAAAANSPIAGSQAETGRGPVAGYVATQSVTGSKTDTPLLETPQSVSVVTKDQIVDQQAQSVVEALRYVPGVSLDAFSANTFFDSVKIRGFDAPRYLDGLRLPVDPGTQFAYPKIETYGLERLEVLKGPSSGLYGQTDPGGLLNMISKRPTAAPRYEVEGQFGSFDRYQGAFDIAGPVDKAGEFLYRLVGLARKSDSQIDFVQDNKVFIAPSFTWRPNANTSLTILAHYQNIDDKGFQQYVPGIGSLLTNPNGRIPYNRYLGEPSVDGYKLEQASVGYEFEHRFNDAIQFRQNFRYLTVSNNLTGVRSEGLQADLRTLNRSINYVQSDSTNIALDNQLQANLLTGPFAHKMLFGLDYQKQNNNSDYRFAFINPIDAFNPVYGSIVPTAASLPAFIKTSTDQKQLGLYAQDQIKIDRFTLTLTGRQDWADADTTSRGLFPAPGVYPQRDQAGTGRVGLNYLFDFGLSPYANYSTSFVPVSGTDASGAAFKPTTGEGKEIGLKFKPNGSNLMLTAAVFEIIQQNVLTADPTNPIFSIQTGEARVRGFEFEARGNLTRELSIVGGFSHLDPRVTRSNDGTVGNYLVNTALDQASLWAKYAWLDGPLAGLGLGAGVRYVGESYGDSANTIRIDPYTLFDAAISYDFGYRRPDLKGLSAQINATNLTDKYYVASCVTSLSYCGLGAGRRILGTLRFAWN